MATVKIDTLISGLRSIGDDDFTCDNVYQFLTDRPVEVDSIVKYFHSPINWHSGIKLKILSWAVVVLKQLTGADLTHIPYKGAAPAMNDLLSRQIHGLFTSTASVQPHTSAGRLKGNSAEVSDPKGHHENSPAFQRWVVRFKTTESRRDER